MFTDDHTDNKLKPIEKICENIQSSSLSGNVIVFYKELKLFKGQKLLIYILFK